MNEERKRILKMVEEGKLTVNEALFLLEQLEKNDKTMEVKQEELMTELSAVVEPDEGQKTRSKKEESNTNSFQSVKDTVFDFVDMAFKKIKNLDLDLNFGQSVDISHIFQHSDTYLDQIDIDLANGSVRMIPWDKKDVRIECNAKVYRVETQEEARRKLLEDAIFAIEGQKMRFAVQQKWMKVAADIYIPREDYDTIRIRLFNGGIEGSELTVKDFKAKTANGKIILEGLDCRKLEAETANGHLKIRRSMINDLEAETINGAITAEGSFRHADLQSFNGQIGCMVENEDCESVEVKSATGGIDISIPSAIAPTGTLKSNLGNFRLEIEGVHVIEEKSEMVQKSLSFRPDAESLEPLRIYAETKTGAIVLKKNRGAEVR
ncbi:DUF4097 family beta strand repeat-containing protein [Mesobacillus zeae]|uniref:DUF4097 domain-containing protein n=1 Tax=Mesobacillus zeae TaxID=1917180 RepID=A0A398B4V8_9BACI|nr:DUF4097 domain-containing protein [Mesobacillus zeae]RID84945.1 DUF4097 domain-containing protein [Mesobacillus zeae]